MSAYIPVAPDRWAEMVQASAEVGPLRNKVSDLSTQLELRQVEIDRLRAENERLRKAGDELANAAKGAGCSECEGMHNRLEDAFDGWNAAKEGGAK